MKKKLGVMLLLLVVAIAMLAFAGCKHKHSYTTSVTEPTCTERGYTTYVCECGDSYTDNYVETKPHTPGAATNENVVGASCTQKGSYDEVVHCANCNAVISSTHHDVDMTAHTPKDEPSRENEVPATCTSQGSYDEVVRCKDCDAVISSTHHDGSTLPHTPKDEPVRENEVPATCTSQGSYNEVVRCKDCNAIISSTPKTIKMLDHTPKAAAQENVVNSTCSIPGSYNEVVRCADCNTIISSTPKTIDTIPHTPSNAVTENNVPATCTSLGSYDSVVYCAVCTQQLSSTHNTVAKLPHNYDYGVCKDCGFKIEDEAQFTAEGFDIDYTTQPATVSCTVSNTTSNIDLVRAFNLQSGSVWKLYSDFEGNHEYKLKAMSLNYGHNTAYIIVYYDKDSDYFTRYKLDIYRLSVRNYTFADFNGDVLSVGTIEENSAVTAPASNPTRDYYGFDCWTLDNKQVAFPYTVTDDIIFTAKYLPTTYNITYVVNGGTLTTDVNDYDIEREVTFDRPTKQYYDFAGWYDNAQLNGQAIAGMYVGNHGNQTFYAKWTPKVYGITYVLNGGALTTSVNDYDIERAVTFDAPKKQYYDFAGWYDNAEFDGNALTGIPVGNHGAKTFYAKYTPTVYGITYVLNGGTITTEVNDYDVERAVTFDNPTRNYYTFDGWYDNADFSGSVIEGIAVGNHGAKTFYAKWTPITYGITYELNGGTLTTDVNDYNVERAVTFDAPTKQYYDFAGWYDNEQLNGDAITGIPVGNHGAKTFYAKWTPIVYTITYQLNGGTMQTAGETFTVEDLPFTPTNLIPNKNNCIFDGWYKDADLTESDITITSIDDSTIYAKWINATSSLTYELSSDGTYYTVTGYTGSNTDIAIPSLYDNTPVTAIGSSAFSGCSSLTSVVIPDSVTTIGSYAFRNCSSLTIYCEAKSEPAGWNSSWNYSDCPVIWDYRNNNKDKDGYEYTIINGLRYAVKDNFATVIRQPSNISGEIIIPSSVNYNDETYSVTSIYSSAFYGCSSLTSIVIPDSVTSIGRYAFDGCSSLTSVVIPDSVTTIGSSAFNGCSSLESMTLPFVGGSATETTASSSTLFGHIFGTSSYAGGTSTKQYYTSSYDTSSYGQTYYIPASLRNVTITGGNILYGAFYNCSSLTSVTIGNSVTSIGSSAFDGCSSLTSVVIPNSVTSIGRYAFDGCSSLTSVVIPNSVTSIGSYAFRNCSSLTSVVIPNSVTSIGYSAFDGCSSLETVYWNATACTSAGSSDYPIFTSDYPIFSGCSKLTTVVIGDNVTTIPSYAFYNCSRLTSVTIGNSVTTIGNYAFYGCTGLKTVYYTGTADEWSKISKGSYNSNLTDATRYYYSETEPALNSGGTAYNGNY